MPYIDITTGHFPLYEIDCKIIDSSFDPLVPNSRFKEYFVEESPILEPTQKLTWLQPTEINGRYIQSFTLENVEADLATISVDELESMDLPKHLIDTYKLSLIENER